jgi:2-polyprenyl-3-methyl-5-hydroxy-6-metoxy-1,4-benzoquinol methylase
LLYDNWVNILQRRWHRNRLLLIREAFLDDNEKNVCDIGCGSGNVVLSFYDQAQRFDAFDYNKECLEFLEQKLQQKDIHNVKMFYWNILEEPPKEAVGFYDKAILNEVIEHFEEGDIQTILAHVKKLLKPNGELLITTPNCGLSLWFPMEFLTDHLGLFPTLWGEQHKVRIYRKSFRLMCEKAGFRVVREGTFGLFSPFLFFLGSRFSDWLLCWEVRHLTWFGAQLFIRVKKED